MRATLLLVLTAAAVTSVDLAYTAHALAGDQRVLAHPQSGAYVPVAVAASVVWAVAVVLARSDSIAATGGVVLGGAAGNVLTLLLWPSVTGVPDPIVHGNVAFSLGDVAVVTGMALVVAVTVVFAVRNRHRLREPVLG